MWEMLTYLGVIIVIQAILLFLNSIFKNKIIKSSYYLSFILLSLVIMLQSRLIWGKLLLFIFILVWAMHYIFLILEAKLEKGKASIRFWIIQAGIVFITALPIIFYMTYDSFKFNVLSIIGILFFLKGFFILIHFKKLRKHCKRFKKNRHSWAEMFIWFGIYLYVIASIPLIPAIISVLSPGLVIYTKLKTIRSK